MQPGPASCPGRRTQESMDGAPQPTTPRPTATRLPPEGHGHEAASGPSHAIPRQAVSHPRCCEVRTAACRHRPWLQGSGRPVAQGEQRLTHTPCQLPTRRQSPDPRRAVPRPAASGAGRRADGRALNCPSTSPSLPPFGQQGVKNADALGRFGRPSREKVFPRLSPRPAQNARSLQPLQSTFSPLLVRADHRLQPRYWPVPVQDQHGLAVTHGVNQGAQLILGFSYTGSSHKAIIARIEGRDKGLCVSTRPNLRFPLLLARLAFPVNDRTAPALAQRHRD